MVKINVGSISVTIMRGISGSGKSTYISNLIKNSEVEVHIVSADYHFINSDQIYVFKPEQLGVAHQKCQDGFIKLIETAERPCKIICDNTNTTVRELEFYVKTCQNQDVDFTIVNVHCELEVAVKRNIHGVPADIRLPRCMSE